MSGLETLWNLSNSHHTRDAKPRTGQLGIDWHKRTQLLNQRVEAEHPSQCGLCFSTALLSFRGYRSLATRGLSHMHARC